MQGKQQDFRTEKYIRYGIRKYSFGAASVAIAAGLMFLGNGVVSATEVQSAETAITTSSSSQGDKETEKAEPKAETVETVKPETVKPETVKPETVKPETEKAAEVKPEVKVEDTKKVNKAILEASIATLESKLSTAKYADATVVSSAKEVLAAAKATLAKADAGQADLDAQAETVSALSTVVTESNTAGFDKKQATEKEAAKAEADKKATPAEKALSVATTTLIQVSSEAEVTNKLAETELSKADVKEENRAAVTEAVAKNKVVLTETKALLADKSVTKEQVDAQLERLNESILAVYNELKNAGIGRDGKFAVNLSEAQTTALKDASTETGKKWLEDHDYSSLSDIKVKTKEENLKEIKDLNDQIQWLDFGDTSAWTGLNANNQLQIGSTYTKELIPGYIVTMRVKELKPFESTEIFKDRVAGTDLASSYQPDKENQFNPANGATGLGANPQNRYTHVANAGLTSGKAKTTIAGTNPAGKPQNGQAAGVKFDVTATYNGKPVKPGIIMTSGEDIGPLESEIYTTNGTPWDLAAIVGYGSNKNAYKPLDQFKDMNGGKTAILKWQDEKFYNALSGKKFATPDAATAGLGSQVFGGYINQNGSGTPVLSTANVTEVGFYIMSSGQQSSMIGIKFSDFGDLPESYGMAEHYLRTQSIDYDTKAIKQIQQPYLGKVKADIDSAPGTRVVGVDSDDAKDNADEGVDQLIAPDNFKQNKDTGLPEVQLVKAPDNTYKVKVIASANGNDKYTDTVAPAYVRGFIDFNGNGKFDKGEESNIATVTGNGQEVELTFTNTQVIDTSKDVVNFRVRIAKDEDQVEKATGIAYSGEVEDNQIRVSHPPRGDYEETTGKQGEKQNIGIEFVNRVEADASELGSNNGKTTFNAYGKIDYTEQRNSISLASTKKVQTEGVMIVKPDGTLAKTYTKEGQGTYEVTDTGVTFTPEANFVGKADGIVLRAVDANGQSTGWTSLTDQHGLVNINDGTHTTTTKTMDAVYVPNVTPKEITADPETSTDVQGKAQKKTPTFKTDAGTDNAATVTPSATYPAKLVDPKTGAKVDSVTVDGEGTYTINPTTGEVTFQPLPTFKGTATGVDVTLTAPVGQNKDGQDVTATATTKYTPTVTAVEPTAKPADSAGVQGETQKGTPTFTAGNAEVPIKENSVKLLNPDGTEANGPVDALDEKGNKVGEYTVNPATGEVTFTPTDKTYTGKVTPAKVQAEDKNGTKVNTTYTPHIVGVTPTATPAESSGIQGEVQDGTVTFAPGETTVEGVKKSVPIKANSAVLLDASGNPVVPGTPVDALDPEGNKVGEYTIDPATNKVTFTPTNKAYKGKVQPVNVQAEDENGTKVSTTYTPTIVGVTPTADPAKSVDVQGATQTGKPVFQGGTAMVNGEEKIVEIDEDKPAKLVDPKTGEQVDSVTVEGEGTYTVAPDGTVTFKPEPQFTGVAKGVEVVRQDKNGTPVKASYTPEVKPVTPTGTDTVTEDIQGSTQTGKPEFKGGTVTIDGKEKTVEINEDKPAKLVDPKTGDPVDSVTIEGEGTYTVAPDGTVTFTPEKNFTGKGTGVTVQREDKNGTPVTAKYTPVVKKATPTGTDAVTEDIQGSTQTGKPTFEGGKVTVNGEEKTVEINEDKPAKLVDPKTGDPVDSVTIEGEGTYTVAPDGTVTFTPEKNFTGKGTGVTVQREDKNGTPVKATYTPVVKPATPTSSDVITTNVQGATQSGTPTFEGGKVTVNGEEKTVEIDETVKPTFDDGTTEKQVPGEGTYTIDENGTVTFTPEKTFTGQATGVTVKRVDKNGTPITAKYTPVVVPVTPTSKDSESEGPKGQPQSGTPTFEGGKVTINGKEVPVEIDETVKPTFDDGTTEKKVPGEGTYTIDENGKVTFTPEPDFVGKASGVTVKRIDKNGTPVTATYTPTVRPDTSFVDKDGNPLSPTEDGTKPTKDIPGYKIIKTEVDEKGNTKHIYEKVTTTHKDKDGNVIPGTTTEEGTTPKKDIPGYRFVETKKLPNGDIEHVYEKVKTSHKDKDGNEIPNYPTEDGEQPKKDIPGYRFVETKKLPNGDIEHVYEKVKTSHKDKDGNEIPNYPTEDGEQPKKDIPGYRFVETKKLPNGDVEHVYEKVKTSHKDKDGNEIPNYPTEDGEQPKKDIPGYRFVETKKLPNGDIEHVYEKVKTSHKDKDGNEIPNYPTEDGEQPKKDIPGYRFVETKKLPNGDIEHVYEKVSTPAPTPSPVPQPTPGKQNTTTWTDENGNPLKPTESGSKEPGTVSGYEYVKTVTDPNGNIKHIFKKVEMPTPRPVEPSQPATPKYVEGQKELPNTGTEDNANLAALGLLGVLSGFGLVARKKKED
ncbi:Ig-like domain-containing protein [Streptococcus vestibularis]